MNKKTVWVFAFLLGFLTIFLVKFHTQDYNLSLAQNFYYYLKANNGDMSAIKALHGYHAFYTGDKEKERYWLEKGASAGSAEFQYVLGDELVSSDDSRSQKKGIDWLLLAAKNEYPSAQFELAKLYEKGSILPPNLTMSESWYRKAALNGRPSAMLKLSEFCEKGVIRKVDLIEAYSWLILSQQYVEDGSVYAKDAKSAQDRIFNTLKAQGWSDKEITEQATVFASKLKAEIKNSDSH